MSRPKLCRPLRLTELESRTVPATLNIDAAGNAVFTGIAGDDNVTLSRNRVDGIYRVQVVGDTISLTGAGAATWSGTGSDTVTGSETTISSWTINLGGGTNNFQLGSTDSAFPHEIVDSVTSVGTGTSDTFYVPLLSANSLLASGGAVNLSITNYSTITLEGSISLLSNNSVTLSAKDDVNIVKPQATTSTIAAGTLSVHAGLDGTGTVVFGSFQQRISANNQTWRAGDRTGGTTTASLDLKTNNPLFRPFNLDTAAPSITVRQDAAIHSDDLPETTQIVNSSLTVVAPQSYTLISDDASITIASSSAVKFATTGLSVTAATQVNLNGLSGANSVRLLSATSGTGTILNDTVNSTGSGGQVYNGPVLLNSNITLTTAGNGPVIFNGTVNDRTTANTNSLTLNTSGRTEFNSTVGGVRSLASLATTSSLTNLAANITTGGTGGIVFNNNVVLTCNSVLTAGNLQPITFGGTLEDDVNAAVRTLSVNTTGTTTFTGAVGGTRALDSLTTDSNGTTQINGGQVRTVNAQTYNDAVSVGGGGTTVAFTTTAGGQTITFSEADFGTKDTTLTADNLNWTSLTGSGQLILQSVDDTTSIGIAGAAGTLQLTTAELDGLADGFTQITVGRSTGTGTITANAFTISDPLLLRTPNGSLNLNGTVTATDDAALNFTAATISAADTIDNGGNLVTVNASTSASFDGVISGSGGFTNTGTGTTTLTADNDYTGITTQTAGTLLVNGSQPDSAVVVTGGTLGGTGEIGSLQSAGVIAPGTSPGRFMVADNASLTGGTLTFELTGPNAGSEYDQLVVDGEMNLGAGVATLNLVPTFIPTDGDAFVLIDTTGGVTGTFAGLAEGDPVDVNGVIYRITYAGGADGRDVALVQSPAITSGNNTIFTVGLPGSFTVTATGSPAPTFSLSDAPGWLSIDPTTGELTGTPPSLIPGPFELTFTITASNGTTDATQEFTLTVYEAPVLSGNPPPATVGTAYTFAFESGGFPTPSFTMIAGMLPPGLSLNAITGEITGTPTDPGRFAFTITATNAAGSIDVMATITVDACPVPPPVPPRANVEYNAVGAGSGGGPAVAVLNTDGSRQFSFSAFEQGFTGGVRVATADLTGDGVDDIIAAAGPGGGPVIQVFDGRDGSLLHSFFAYDPGFRGGVFVAADDGILVTGAGAGGGPHVKVFRFSDGDVIEIASFLAFDASFTGGVSVGVNGTSVVVGAGSGGSPHVKRFELTQDGVRETASFFAFSPTFTGGDSVALLEDGRIAVSAGEGGGPQVNLYSGDTLQLLASFFAFAPEYTGGTTVAASGAGTLLVSGGSPLVLQTYGPDDELLAEVFAFVTDFNGRALTF